LEVISEVFIDYVCIFYIRTCSHIQVSRYTIYAVVLSRWAETAEEAIARVFRCSSPWSYDLGETVVHHEAWLKFMCTHHNNC
jgi:putative component of membrane protein insertase Oxa1/YidC/SpoIIIJ protein YidD